MKPSLKREIYIKPGTPIGLEGDYNAPSLWTKGIKVPGLLKNYIIIERHHSPWKTKGETEWDTAAIVILNSPLDTVTTEGKEMVVKELLLIQRYSESSWDDHCTVHVFGILDPELLHLEEISLKDWKNRTEYLSFAADLTYLNMELDLEKLQKVS